jgi:two-component system phosphate regulon response regulator PhoB
LRILVIEDNPDIKEVLDYILSDEGHEAIQCSDGSSLTALESINPDLILMDEILSRNRGSELIKKLKTDENTRSIPVVLISAMPNLENIAAKCGADAFLEKPFNIDNLTDIIKILT